MKVTFEFEGLKELQNRLETLASDSEIRKTNKQIFQRSVDYTEPRMKAVMARSADNSKSGKKGTDLLDTLRIISPRKQQQKAAKSAGRFWAMLKIGFI